MNQTKSREKIRKFLEHIQEALGPAFTGRSPKEVIKLNRAWRNVEAAALSGELSKQEMWAEFYNLRDGDEKTGIAFRITDLSIWGGIFRVKIPTMFDPDGEWYEVKWGHKTGLWTLGGHTFTDFSVGTTPMEVCAIHDDPVADFKDLEEA